MLSKTLDLHYLTSAEAVSKILLALYELETSDSLKELKIITGNGEVLKNLAINLIEEEGFNWKLDYKNPGALIVSF